MQLKVARNGRRSAEIKAAGVEAVMKSELMTLQTERMLLHDKLYQLEEKDMPAAAKSLSDQISKFIKFKKTQKDKELFLMRTHIG